MPTLQQPEIYLNNVAKALDAHGKLVNDDMKALLQKFVTTFAAWIERHPKV